MPSDKEMVLALCEALRPFARAYIGLTPGQQIALADCAPVRVTYLRDAYLMLCKVEGQKRPTPFPPFPK
jgi:hypothetical protein